VATVAQTARWEEGQAPPRGVWAWVYTWLGVVDHKRIGLLYLLGSTVFLVAAGIEGLLMRIQLWSPNAHFVSPEVFNQLFTVHGTTMIFLVIMPMLVGGFGNLLVPLMIGARDVAFPRLNALSLWLFLLGGIFINSGWFLGGEPNAGWFSYFPISASLYNPGHGIDWYAIGVQITGIGTLLTAVNFMTTILNMRAPGMTMMRMPLFVWTILTASIIILFSFPPLTINLFFMIFDRLLHTQFFNATTGGDPLLWANLFWIFGHPEVYIMALPSFGIVSEIASTFARKPLFGYTTMVLATLGIGFISFMVWAHHMFTLGLGPWVNSIFAATSMIIAIPTGIKVFNWLGTLWGGNLYMRPALLFVLAFLLQFTLGGITGVMVAMAPVDLQYNDSYFVVAHFHYVLGGGSLFALLGAWHYWFPKITGRLLHEGLGYVQFALSFVGLNLLFFPMHFLGLMGMPRRVATYPDHLGLTLLNRLATVGAIVLAAGVAVFLVNAWISAVRGKEAGDDPWDARTLEWATSSPPPPYNFARIPLVRGRDPLWLEKRYGNGRPPAAPGQEEERVIRLPAPTLVPLALAAGVALAAYSALYAAVVPFALGVAWSLVALVAYMFAPQREEEVALRPAQERAAGP
jgi:cytochrome c oxidase subunit 1